MGGDTKDKAGVWGGVPNLYYARQLSDTVFLGLGINAPFGLSTEYSKDWVGRYHAVESVLHTVNINPAIAFKINDQLSMGIGVNAQYIYAKITNAIDFGLIGAMAGVPGLLPTSADGSVKLEGDDWSWGYNLGLLLNATNQTRVGIQYRSKIRHTLEGDADFSVPGTATALTLGADLTPRTGDDIFIDTDVESTIDLPASASLSLHHTINSKWAIMADVSWPDWSQLDELRFEFDSAQHDGVTTLKWEDSYRYSIGTTYKASEHLIYRAGVAFDETPIPNSYYRTPRIPGEDRTWLAIGLGYKYSDRLSFDFGYAHLFVKDPKIDKTPQGIPTDAEFAPLGYLRGEYDATTDIISAQLKWTF